MAENSAIEWTDATVNFWWGCTKVGPGCEHCYAEAWSKRTGGGIWGVGQPRRQIKSAGALIAKLHATASRFYEQHGRRRRVFIQSMSDLFDLEVSPEWFGTAIDRIEAAGELTVQIVTKRVSAVEKRLAEVGRNWPRNAGLIISLVNQQEADRDVPRLLALKAKLGIPWVGLSMEPLLGPVNLRAISTMAFRGAECLDALTGVLTGLFGDPCSTRLPALDWVIVGGESGPGARPMHPDWARSLRDQCAAAGVPFLFKQWGEHSLDYDRDRDDPDWRRCSDQEKRPGRWINLEGGWGFHGERVHYAARVGKKAAGRLLDGVQHDGVPA